MALNSVSLAARTAYADLVERCFAAAFEQSFANDGAFTAKTVRGRRYWYFQSSDGEKRRQTYVGPETEELLDRIGQHRSVLDDERDRRSLVSMLVRSAYLPSPDRRIGEVVAALERAGAFRLRAVLVGTIAYQTYSAMLGVRLPAATMQTGDVDIAQHRTISLAAKDSTPPPLEILREVDPSFRPTPHAGDPRSSTSYRATGGLRVDFLTPNRGADTDEPVALPSLSTDAQPLRFLDYLIHEPVRAVLLHGSGVPVITPAPERYALHKLIITQRRRRGSEKGSKDVAQAEALLDVFTSRKSHELSTAWAEAWVRGKAWRGLLGQGMTLLSDNVRDRTLQTVGATRSIVPGLDLTFSDPPARYDVNRQVLTFWADAGGARHRCAVSRESLEDHFGSVGAIKEGAAIAFRAHRGEIERLLREKYLNSKIQDLHETILRTADVELLRMSPRR
jgi:hypothetical protein